MLVARGTRSIYLTHTKHRGTNQAEERETYPHGWMDGGVEGGGWREGGRKRSMGPHSTPTVGRVLWTAALTELPATLQAAPTPTHTPEPAASGPGPFSENAAINAMGAKLFGMFKVDPAAGMLAAGQLKPVSALLKLR